MFVVFILDRSKFSSLYIEEQFFKVKVNELIPKTNFVNSLRHCWAHESSI